jgi:hypothetical protein
MLSFRGWLYSSFLYLGPGQLVKKRKKHSWNRTRSDLGSKDRPRLYQALNANILTVAEKWSESSCGVLRNSKIIWLSLRKVFLSLRGTNVYIVYLYIYIHSENLWYINNMILKHMTTHDGAICVIIHWIPGFRISYIRISKIYRPGLPTKLKKV